METENKTADKPAAKSNPFAGALKKLTAPKGHETGPHGPENEKYARQKQLLEDLRELFGE